MTSARIENCATVYIVDDDPAIRASISDLMDSVGVSTLTFASAEDFLEARNANMSGCLLLDVRLPGINGMEMQTKLSESGFNIPIIIMTAHGDMPMVRKALKSGAVEFLINPFGMKSCSKRWSKRLRFAVLVNGGHYCRFYSSPS